MSETFIVALDFGTTFSGYAYSLTPTSGKPIPAVKLWRQRTGQDTSKTPTCILFDKDQEFIDFGYSARDRYYEMHKETAKDYYYFKEFKMELYGKKITKDLVITDVTGKKMKALKVFSEALRFLKDDALETISEQTNDYQLPTSDFTWVLTVPAVWDVSARQFMRRAALQAGIVSTSSEDNLVIALEPEAASVWCKKLPSEGFIDDGETVDVQMSPGTQYIVVDCGGGIIDITVHEILEGGALKELHKASGNDQGGRTVDRKFIKCLREFFCDGLWEEYERDHPNEAQQFVEDFVYVIKADHTRVRLLDFDRGFRDMVERKKTKNVYKPTHGVHFSLIKQSSAKLEMSEQKMESIFNNTLTHITKSMNEILKKNKKPETIKYILLVGGLSSGYILRRHIRNTFRHQARVLSPKNPQEAVMKGAVLFGRDPSLINSRKSAYTYGFSKVMRFDPSKHKAEKKITTADGDWCRHLFRKMVEVDEVVGWNETRQFTVYPVEGDQKQMSLDFYRTEKKDPTYTDEWGVQGPVASCDVPTRDFRAKGMDREVKLDIFFGSTEITATATDVSSRSAVSVRMDFLTN